MTDDPWRRPSRRDFLKWLGASAAAVFTGRLVPRSAFAQGRAFEMLVVGDSLVWGQGLQEPQKFYSLTADWLRSEVFGARRVVNVKVKAHSGATFKFDPKAAQDYRKAGRDEAHSYPGEVNVAFPSMFKQVESAAAEYRAEGIQGGADLVMITGGITDITVEKVLDPYDDPAKLTPLIEKYCRDGMTELLEHVAAHNPDARIAVVGYFPMISSHSSSSRVFSAWLYTLGVPKFIRVIANNPLFRRLFFQKLRKRAIARSKLWMTESDKNLQAAVDRVNTKLGGSRAIFIKGPLTEEHAAEAPNTKLFRMKKNGSVEDPVYAERKSACKTSLTDLKKTTGIDWSIKRCTMAAVGHPDPAGARAYADAIKQALSGIFR
jgi:lysophospholipase L1-like esterase